MTIENFTTSGGKLSAKRPKHDSSLMAATDDGPSGVAVLLKQLQDTLQPGETGTVNVDIHGVHYTASLSKPPALVNLSAPAQGDEPDLDMGTEVLRECP